MGGKNAIKIKQRGIIHLITNRKTQSRAQNTRHAARPQPYAKYTPQEGLATHRATGLDHTQNTQPAIGARPHEEYATPQPHPGRATATGPGSTQNAPQQNQGTRRTGHATAIGPSLPKARQPGYQAAKHY